ncbi:MAG TPA: hypothetical protein VKA76_03435 [Gammaproteobacteria bacterium]|nr:hypothetical protein [Gammaproteobacteria bacterium]
MKRSVIAGGAALALCGPASHAAQQEDLAGIRAQIQQLRNDYQKRIDELEERLAQAEAQARSAQRSARRAEQVATAPAAVPPPAPKSANAYNPALSVILMGGVNAYSRDPGTYALPGFQLDSEAGLAEEGPTIGESELTFSANVDDQYYGSLTTAIHSPAGGATEVNIEEAYLEAPRLPAGLGVKFGRFYSGIGYLNSRHRHAWNFADAPLAYRAFLGGQYGDDGVQIRWLAPTDRFIELGGELLRGANFPGGGIGDSRFGARSLFAHTGGDIGISSSWRLGVSRLWSRPHAREGMANDAGVAASSFAGDSNLTGVDFVWKWAPAGNPYARNLVVQAELFRRDEAGRVTVNDTGMSTAYDGIQYGGYAQAVYQFMPRWRIGARYDWLSADNHGADPSVLTQAGLLDQGHKPSRYTLMMDFANSEFSRLRLQYDQDRSLPRTDRQWLFQYVMSLGAHGAHAF